MSSSANNPPPLPRQPIPRPVPLLASPITGAALSQLPPQTQPKTVKLSSNALWSLPYRLLHPPPAQEKLTSWSITPSFNVTLQDVLDRKHLPPLGLKDFEEWLLFVERTPENLYFILWLREYTARYTSWAQQSKQALLAASSPPHTTPTSPFPTPMSRFSPTHSHAYSPAIPTFAPPLAAGMTTRQHDTPSPTSDSDADSGFRFPIPKHPHPHPRKHRHRRPGERQRYHAYPTPPPPPNPSLALFYLKAKQTFLTPNAPYELDVPSDVLAVFHPSSASGGKWGEDDGRGGLWGRCYGYGDDAGYVYGFGYGGFDDAHFPLPSTVPTPPPPDPAVFAELAELTSRALQASLARFVIATYNNVGMPRAWCGATGGTVIGLVGSLPPIVANFATGGSRWWRLAALPGMWFGLTIAISAMYGVCMMIYVFGDLRQLRSFELARPAISPPKLLGSAKYQQARRPEISAPMMGGVGYGREKGSAVVARVGEREAEAEEKKGRPVLRIVPPSPSPVLRTEIEVGEGEERRGRRMRGGKKRSGRESSASCGDRSSADDAWESSSATEGETGSSVSGSGSDGEDGGEGDDDDGSECESLSCESADVVKPVRPRILISDAMYDEHPSPEGPATGAEDGFEGAVGRGGIWSHGGGEGEAEEVEGGVTAGFIHAFVYEEPDFRFGSAPYAYSTSAHSEAATGRTGSCATAERQRVDAFDFDALPPRGSRRASEACGAAAASAFPPLPLISPSAPVLKPLPPARTKLSSPPGAGSGGSQRAWRGQFRLKVGHATESGVNAKPNSDLTCGDGDGEGCETATDRARAGVWTPRGALAYFQSRCSPGNVVAHLAGEKRGNGDDDEDMDLEKGDRVAEKEKEKQEGTCPVSPTGTVVPLHANPDAGARATDLSKATKRPKKKQGTKAPSKAKAQAKANGAKRKWSWRQGFKRVSMVPPFGSPLTPVLNPIVGRAQWEIVVRSALMAAVVSCVVVGGLVGVPQTR